MTEMIPEVCSCLTVPGIRSEACSVLVSMDRVPVRELSHFYLTSATNLNARKAALFILGKDCSEENAEFLLEIVFSSIRQLKEAALEGLLNCCYKADEKGKDDLKSIYETFGLLSWITDIKTGLLINGRIELAGKLTKNIFAGNHTSITSLPLQMVICLIIPRVLQRMNLMVTMAE